MNHTMLSKHPIIIGTLFLTLAGLLSRTIGFFYRIFLSHTIGAEGVGIYQLIFPIYALTFSLTVAGIQTSISKFVAEVCAADNLQPSGTFVSSSKNTLCRFTYLYSGLFLSLLLSLLCTCILYFYADTLAFHVLGELRCAPLLKILAFTIPFGAIHSCINGYYYGLQKTSVPSLSQLFEQFVRVGGVYFLYRLGLEQGKAVTIEIAVWGLVMGEIAAVLYSITFTRFQKHQGSCLTATKQIFGMAFPLTVSRVFINLFQSIESIMIPIKLEAFGYSPQDALRVFGVLTGMAMPMILFPSAITNSVAVMLLPAVSEAAANKDLSYIKNAIKKSCFYCITLGFSCTFLFLVFGKWIGQIAFGNQLAGTLIVILSWTCPFLYLTTTLNSILNGLGKTRMTLFLNLLSSAIRICFVIFFIPLFGIEAYLLGILFSYLTDAGIAILFLKFTMLQKISSFSST